MQHPAPQKTRLVALDAVRGLAIVLVIIFHYLHDRLFGGVANIVTGPLGLGGVTLFFMLSGFLIERHLARDANLIRFYGRRLFRILPAYIVCLAAVVAIGRASGTSEDWTPFTVTVNALMLQDVFGVHLMLGVIWTLLIEIKFYALAPFVTRAGPLALRLAPYAAIALNALIFATRGQASTLLTYLTFCFVGMQLGPWMRGELSTLAVAALMAATAVATYLFAIFFALGLAIFVVVNVIILAAALTRPIAIPVLPFLGKVSYSWYLYHPAVGYPILALVYAALGTSGAAQITAVAAATIASLLSAWLSFALIERPGNNAWLKSETYLQLPPPPAKLAG